MQKQDSRRRSKIVLTEITSRTTDRFTVALERCGGIAQLGERLNGIQEVSGSIPLISTKQKALKTYVFKAFSLSFLMVDN